MLFLVIFGVAVLVIEVGVKGLAMITTVYTQ